MFIFKIKCNAHDGAGNFPFYILNIECAAVTNLKCIV